MRTDNHTNKKKKKREIFFIRESNRIEYLSGGSDHMRSVDHDGLVFEPGNLRTSATQTIPGNHDFKKKNR